MIGAAAFEVGNAAATLLILRATDLFDPGRSQDAATQLALVLYNVAATLISIPAGHHGDRFNPFRVLAGGASSSPPGTSSSRPVPASRGCSPSGSSWPVGFHNSATSLDLGLLCGPLILVDEAAEDRAAFDPLPVVVGRVLVQDCPQMRAGRKNCLDRAQAGSRRPDQQVPQSSLASAKNGRSAAMNECWHGTGITAAGLRGLAGGHVFAQDLCRGSCELAVGSPSIRPACDRHLISRPCP
jgi:hypothetical protein